MHIIFKIILIYLQSICKNYIVYKIPILKVLFLSSTAKSEIKYGYLRDNI